MSAWLSVDRFADKYPGLSAYSYAANNPLRYVDANGDSLIVSGSASAVSSFESTSNTGLGGFYTLGKTSTGKYKLNSTGKAGTMTSEQQAFFDTMNEVISNGKDVSFDVVDGSDALSGSIYVGDNGRATGITASPGKHTIDIGDVQQFGTGGLLTSQGALGHEIKEGFEIQTNGVSPYDAHFKHAIPRENKINGTTSAGAALTRTGGKVIINVPVTYSGGTKTVSLEFTGGNILPGGVKNNSR